MLYHFSNVWYHMKAYSCAKMKAKHTWKQSIQTYKNHMFLQTRCTFSVKTAHKCYHFNWEKFVEIIGGMDLLRLPLLLCSSSKCWEYNFFRSIFPRLPSLLSSFLLLIFFPRALLSVIFLSSILVSSTALVGCHHCLLLSFRWLAHICVASFYQCWCILQSVLIYVLIFVSQYLI